MQNFIKTSVAALTLLVLAGCQNPIESPELNQCAQQNYQCESTCEQQSSGEGLKHQVCSGKCVESYNQCKVQAEKLGSL